SPYLGRCTLLRTEDQNRGEAIGIQYDPQFGWGDLVVGGLDIHYLPGSHLDLLKEPNVQVLAETLRNCLTQAQSPKN
ncbi:MAG: thioesterase domain-containing protein, partial [Nostoc sp.]